MKKMLSINKDAYIKVSSNIIDFLTPDNVYLPIDKTANLLIHSKNVKKGELLYVYNNKNYYSPISGKIKNIVEKKVNDGKINYFLQIVNDFQENDSYSGVSEMTTIQINTDFLKKLKGCPLYDWHVFSSSNELIINGMEDEPYIVNKTFLHKLYVSEILQMLDLISNSFNIPKIILCLKENDRESIETFENVRGSFPFLEIRILPDVYPVANPIILKKYLHLPIESVILDTFTIYDIYREVIKERRKDVIFVTLTGNAILKPVVIRVKIGTLLKDVITKDFEYKDNEYNVIVNGLLNGYECVLEDVLLTEDIKVIYFMKKDVCRVSECIKCGKCNEVCPVQCNPYLSYLLKDKSKSKNCFNCGLCSYVCPSHIPLYKYVGGKNE